MTKYYVILIIGLTLLGFICIIRVMTSTALADTETVKIIRETHSDIAGNPPPIRRNAPDSTIPQIRTTTNYIPSELCIPINTKVVWLNTDRTSHTVTQEKTNITSVESFGSGLIKPHSNHTHIFTSVGNYSYSDKKDPSTSGDIQVLPTKQDCDTYWKNLEIVREKAIAAERSRLDFK